MTLDDYNVEVSEAAGEAAHYEFEDISQRYDDVEYAGVGIFENEDAWSFAIAIHKEEIDYDNPEKTIKHIHKQLIQWCIEVCGDYNSISEAIDDGYDPFEIWKEYNSVK